MMRGRVLWLLLLFFASRIMAADVGMTVDAAGIQPRMNGPVPFPVTVHWDAAEVLEGRLEATVLRRNKVMSVTKSPPLFLSREKRPVLLMIPPPAGISPGDSLEVMLRFVAGTREWDGGLHRLGSIQLGDAKELVLGIVRNPLTPPKVAAARERALALESHIGRMPIGARGHVTTRRAAMNAEELPVNAALMCAFDAVFIDGVSFAKLGEKQLTALLRWVRAGGNLALSTGDANAAALSERHLAFLRRLAEGSGFRINADAGGRLLIEKAGAACATAMLAPELGRLVVFNSAEVAQDFDGPVWRRAMFWLWNARQQWLDERVGAGELLEEPRFADDRRELWVERAAAGFAPLAPDAPRQIPLGILAAVLVALLVIVSPGEWFVLGWLKRRRWTWVVFPMACAACTWAVSGLAKRSVGFQDRSGSLRIVDVGADGRILRDVRFEQVLPSTDRVWRHEGRDGAAVPVPRGISDDAIETTAKDSVPTNEWMSADRLVVTRPLQQWTPAMTRVTTFPDSLDDSGIDWSRISDAALEAERKASGVVVVDGWSAANSASVSFWQMHDEFDQAYLPGLDSPSSDSSETRAIATTMARTPDVANYALIRRHNPALGGHYSDLATAGKDAPPFTVAWRRVGTELVIYRKHSRQPVPAGEDYRDQ